VVNSITLASPDFFIDSTRTSCAQGSKIPKSGQCEIAVFYKPTTSAFTVGRLVVSDNASNSPQSTKLQGGAPPKH
jgi:hypothetical protein